MIGRWPSGAPVDLTPLADDPTLGSDPNRNNNFDYSHPGFLPNMDQSHCPFSAHTRKTRPRSDLGNSNVVNQAIRAGIPYGPEVTDEENNNGVTSEDRGLAFGGSFFQLFCVFRVNMKFSLCSQSNINPILEMVFDSNKDNGPIIQRAFFSESSLVQLMNQCCSFPPAKNETVGLDPVIGQVGNNGARTTFGLNPFDPLRSYSIPAFIKSRGGEYFFSPSISALKNTIAH